MLLDWAAISLAASWLQQPGPQRVKVGFPKDQIEGRKEGRKEGTKVRRYEGTKEGVIYGREGAKSEEYGFCNQPELTQPF